jgi:hypothetical protein
MSSGASGELDTILMHDDDDDDDSGEYFRGVPSTG